MNILAIGAHPDDLEFGCGGTLLKLSKISNIYLLVLTKGEVGGDPEVRVKEQNISARILGAKKVFWSNYFDTQIPLSKDLINTIENVIRKVNPQLIFTHYINDTHQDHRNTAQATITATRYIRNVLFYEVPTTVDFSPSIFVNIDPVLKRKLELLKAHKSQVYATRVAKLSILESAKSTAIFRGYQDRVKYAEGFMSLRFSLDLFIK